MLHSDRTPCEWFHEAERCYTEHHQGCAWCGGSHRVFRLFQEDKLIFYCNFCDFRVSHDPGSDLFQAIPGEEQNPLASTTMVQL